MRKDILEIDTDVFVKDIFKSIKDYENLDNQMERSNFSFKFENKLNISCEKANVAKGLFYKSPDWLKYKSTTINPKNVNDRYFPYDFDHTQHYKKSKIIVSEY